MTGMTELTPQQAAQNIVAFLEEQHRAETRKIFILSRIAHYTLIGGHRNIRQGYGFALDSNSQIDLQHAIEADIEQTKAIDSLPRRVENLEALLGQILERLDRLEDSWVKP